MNRGASKGFTLIEMMVVLIIVTVVLTIGLPAYHGFGARNALKAAAEGVASSLHYARSESILRGEGSEVTVVFDTDGGDDWCYGMTTATTCDCAVIDPTASDACIVQHSGEDILRVVDSDKFSGKVNLTTVTLPSNLVSFTAVRGLGDAGTVSLVANGQQIDVAVSAVGRIRVCSDGSLGYPSC